MATIRTPNGATDSEASLRKVQAVAHGSTDPVVGSPLQKRGVDSALENEILNEATDFVVSKSAEQGCAKAEAAT
jgi:hypothetical protein